MSLLGFHLGSARSTARGSNGFGPLWSSETPSEPLKVAVEGMDWSKVLSVYCALDAGALRGFSLGCGVGQEKHLAHHDHEQALSQITSSHALLAELP